MISRNELNNKSHNQGLLFKTYSIIKENFVDSTALTAASMPIFAGLEKVVLEMSDDVSIQARILAAVTTYIGFGAFISKGRDEYRKLIKINDASLEKFQTMHDVIYMAGYNLIISPAFYYVAGSRDANEIIGGTALSIGFGLGAGWFLGYSVDFYRDFLGTKKSERVPEFIKNKSSNFKLGLAAVLTATSIALTAMVYTLTPNYESSNKKIEQKELEFERLKYNKINERVKLKNNELNNTNALLMYVLH
ncbi:MAG: hypothetical protein WC758_00270 [Candidatus Woesearchaeota archaeon]|jgi:hypothetical protein